MTHSIKTKKIYQNKHNLLVVKILALMWIAVRLFSKTLMTSRDQSLSRISILAREYSKALINKKAFCLKIA